MNKTDAYQGAERMFCTTSRGTRLRVLRCAAPDSPHAPVLLTHGTFSDARIVMRLARFLHARGFDTWVFEWRGHGESEHGDHAPSYEDFAEDDLASACEFVLGQTGASALSFVGHSAGGVLPWMLLARHASRVPRFRAIVSVASQTTHAGRSPKMRLGLVLAWLVTNVAGKAPAKLFRLGPHDETRPLMNQWARWNLAGRWVGKGDFDYRRALRSIDVPALFLAGGGDRTIAPLAGIRQLFEDVGSGDKSFLHCSKSDGFLEDYDHARIIASRNAEAEIWPRIGDWLGQRA